EDPHGDPIPNANGEIFVREKELLSETQVSKKYMCVGVKDTSSVFLQYLDRQNISLGTSFIVTAIEMFDQSVSIEINGNPLTLSKIVARSEERRVGKEYRAR